MTKTLDPKAALAEGVTPRTLNDAAREEHGRRVDEEIAAGKWRCPICGAPMKRWGRTASVLVCSRGDH